MVVLLSLLLVLSGGMGGVAAAADGPVSTTPLQLDGDGITVDDEDDVAVDEADEEDTGDSFEVTDLDAPDTVAIGETVTVSATISNPNEFETNQSVEFRIDGDVVARESLSLDGENEKRVSVEIDTDELGVGSYIHGFLTVDRGELAVLDVIPAAEVDFEDQESDGETVIVERATLSEGGFVAIYEDDKLIGVSDYLDDGEHEEIEIELFDDDFDEFDRTKLDGKTTLTAVAHLDTGETEEFEFVEDDSVDKPYVDVDGEPITATATVTVPTDEDADEAEDETDADEADEEDDEADDEVDEADDEADEADEDESDDEAAITPAVDFSDQESDGTTVTVDTAVLPVDGYVVIYEDDEIIGVSEYLEPDEYNDTEIELFDVPDASFDRDQLTETTTLVAVLHEETSDNEEFDHVENDNLDRPLVDDDDIPVFDTAEITVPAAEETDDPDSEDESETDDETDSADDDVDDDADETNGDDIDDVDSDDESDESDNGSEDNGSEDENDVEEDESDSDESEDVDADGGDDESEDADDESDTDENDVEDDESEDDESDSNDENGPDEESESDDADNDDADDESDNGDSAEDESDDENDEDEEDEDDEDDDNNDEEDENDE